jgi:hypothetical protein
MLQPSTQIPHRRPLAQDFVKVVQCPTDPAYHLLIDDVSLIKLPSGRLYCSYTFNRDSVSNNFQRDGGNLTVQWSNPNQFNASTSDDGGRTWKPLPAVNINMGFPFIHRGELHLIGNALGRKDIIILKSADEGRTWTKPVTLFTGNYWNTPAGTVIRDGWFYRAMGTTGPGKNGGGWNGCVVIAGDLDTDLMDASHWRMSNAVHYPGTPPALIPAGQSGMSDSSASGAVVGHWLEGNVVDVHGKLRVILVTRQLSMVGVCDLHDDGKTLKLEFCMLYPVPGGNVKMFITYDPETELFWSQCNIPIDPFNSTGWHRKAKMPPTRPVPMDRHILTMVYSVDALNWFQAGAVVIGESMSNGFQYAAPLIDGDDMLFAVRSALEGAPCFHDAQHVTFHRVKNFRSLAHQLRTDE